MFVCICMYVYMYVCKYVCMYIACVPTSPRGQKSALHLLKLVLQMIMVGAENRAHVLLWVSNNCSSHPSNPLRLISNLDMFSFLCVAYF